MRGDDRPRPKPPKKTAEGGPPKTCCECRLVFTEDVLKRGVGYRARQDGSVVCQDHKSCRSRQLTIKLGKELGTQPGREGEWLFFKYPRDLVRAQMDVRPKDWKVRGWLARYSLAERVLACVLYHSWCYPVCLEYAVQLAGTCPRIGRDDPDPDETLLDLYRRPLPLREVDIARILNEHQPNVSRALKRLQATKNIRMDEDRVISPAAKLLDMSVAERQALYRQELLDTDPELKGVPANFRATLMLIEEHCPVDLSSDIFAEVQEQCTWFNGQLRDIRTARNEAIEKACTRGVSYIPDFEKLPRKKRAGVSPVREPDSPPASTPPADANRRTPDIQVYTPPGASSPAVLYEGIPRLQKLYPQAPFAHPPFNALGKADRQLALRILDALEGEGWDRQHRRVTPDEVSGFLAFVEIRFRDGRSPLTPAGPKKLGLLIDWAADYARELPELRDLAAQLAAVEERGRQLAAAQAEELRRESAWYERARFAWAALPAEDRNARTKRARERLKQEARWRNMAGAVRESETERYAIRELQTELATRAECAAVAGGSDEALEGPEDND